MTADIYRVIDERGHLLDNTLPDGLDAHRIVALFRSLVLLRTFDERAVALQRQGRIGTYPLSWGEEATQAGPFHACRDDDWVFPSYRQNAIGILRGISPAFILRYRRGHGGEQGFWSPRRYRVAPIAIAIATHLPHAVGLSWAAKMRGEDIASIVWFGDGATSEGDFHEAMNFAGVFKTPTVFFCTNNQWAISTPFHRQTASETIVAKAEAYGIAGVRVDGFDPIACWKVARDALARARGGGGPTLIEASCYRLGPHATADDPRLYRDEQEAERWRALEPLVRMSKFLTRRGILDEEGQQACREEARATIGDAVREMEQAPRPGPEVLFDYVYKNGKPWTLQQGLAELTSDTVH